MVSVIVPVYNAEKTLMACVQSILDQTYTEYELILIDDGSVDDSGRICDELQENCRSQGRPCQVVHQENRGVSAARNCGMEHANGEYFVCVDSDDLIDACYLEDLVRAAEEHPELGYILCGFRCSSHVHDYIYSAREDFSVLDRADYMLLFDRILIQSPCLALYKTETVRKHGIRMREDLSLAEDILFNLAYLDALDQTGIGVVNKPNYLYQNEDPSSLYRKYRQDLLTINETVSRELSVYLKKWNVVDDASWKLYYNAVFYQYANVLKNTFHENNPMTSKEKIAYNNAVLCKTGFQEALAKMSARIPAPLLSAYRSGNYRRVIAAEKIQRFKRALFETFKR